MEVCGYCDIVHREHECPLFYARKEIAKLQDRVEELEVENELLESKLESK